MVKILALLSLSLMATIQAFANPGGYVRLVASTKTSAVVAGTNYRLALQFTPIPQMILTGIRRNGQYPEIGTFPLDGSVDAVVSGRTAWDEPAMFERSTVEKKNDGYHIALLYRSTMWKRKEIIFRFYPTFFTYRMRVQAASPDQRVQTIYYTARSGAGAEIRYGQGNFREIFTWTPDLYDVLLPDQGMSNIALSTHGQAEQPGYVRGYHAGSPLVPPYVAAIRSGSAWWGVGTLGIPAARDGLRLLISRNSLAIAFDMGAVSSMGEESRETPKVGFFFGKKPPGILAAYLHALDMEGLRKVPQVSNWQPWWSGPIYCTWGDQAYAERMREGRLDEAHGSRYVTARNVERWLGIAKQEKLPIQTVIIDLGWQLAYGDFLPNPQHFPDMRGFIDKLHRQGLHVLLWNPMYEATGKLFNLDQAHSRIAVEHPDWLVRMRDGKLTDLFDYTNPAVRHYIRSRIHYLLSPQPGCLNADGLKIDFMSRVPNPANSVFHDPSWGTGELMSYKVLELIYQAAKQAKPDALIDSSFMNPLFCRWQDVLRLNDDVSNSRDTYWWRAWVAAANGIRAVEGDDWWAMDSYFVPLTLAKAAWGIPTIYALAYRGVQGSEGPIVGVRGIASGGFPIKITREPYRQVAAILDVYLHAPADDTQVPHVDPETRLACRTYTIGPLRGFYAARTLNFAHSLVTYTPESAWVTSTVDGTVTVPLPKGYAVNKVVAVDFEGRAVSVKFHENSGTVEFMARDSGKGVSYYVVEYSQTSRRNKFGE